MKKRSVFLLLVIILVVAGYNIIGRIYPMYYHEAVEKYSAQYGIDPLLIMAVIKAESNFESSATSHKSANGLMQITNDTAQWCAEKMGVDNYTDDMLYDGDFNIQMGIFYLDYLLERYNGIQSNAIAAYNAGMGNVDEWLKNKEYSPDGVTITKTPFGETTSYLNKVNYNYKIYKLLYGGKING